MFEDNEYFEVYPIFLEHLDTLPQDCYKKYKNIRVISNDEDVKNVFSDIDVCVNNLWIAKKQLQRSKNFIPLLKLLQSVIPILVWRTLQIWVLVIQITLVVKKLHL